jgi:CheY-like chemotaxis protein
MTFPQANLLPAEVPTETPSRNILVIDDSALIRAAAEIALGEIGGWRTATAIGGEQGIELADSESFDAILIDLVMDGMDGIAVAEELRSRPSTRSVPIVLLTAELLIDSSERFRSAHIDGVISKPFDISALSRDLSELLGW